MPVDELVEESCRSWLKSSFHALDPDRHVRIYSLIRPGSVELVDLYLRQEVSGVALANDTSCGVGYAPLDDLERVVLEVEKHLNSEPVKAMHRAIGEDIKVMGVRHMDAISLTVACAFIDRFISDVDEYVASKAIVASLALESANKVTQKKVTVEVNTADDISSGSLYLTVTGTSAESGDDGEVGRGNRANGLITPYRPMTMEAVAGKKPRYTCWQTLQPGCPADHRCHGPGANGGRRGLLLPGQYYWQTGGRASGGGSAGSFGTGCNACRRAGAHQGNFQRPVKSDDGHTTRTRGWHY